MREEKRRVEFMIFRGHRVKNEKKTISKRGTVAAWSGGSAKGPQYFKPTPPPPAHHPDAQWSFVIFPECPRKHPVYVPPSDCYQIHPQPWNKNKGSCSDPAVWGHVYEKLSHPLETIIGTEKETRYRHRSFR